MFCPTAAPVYAALRRGKPAGMRSAVAPEGWQSTLRKAQGAGKGIRTCTDLYGPSFAGGFGGQAAQGYVGAVRSGNSKAHSAAVGQNIPVHSLTHGARPFGAERAGA